MILSPPLSVGGVDLSTQDYSVCILAKLNQLLNIFILYNCAVHVRQVEGSVSLGRTAISSTEPAAGAKDVSATPSDKVQGWLNYPKDASLLH